MHPSNTNGETVDKTGGSSIDKSGVTVIDVPGHGGVRVDAEHVIDVGNGRKQIIYLGPKSDGIDFIVTNRTVTARSERAQDILDAHTRTDTRDVEDDGEGPVTGMCDRCSDHPVLLTSEGLCDPCYHLACPGCDTGHVAGYDGTRCTEECDPRDDEDDSERSFVADGGSRITSGDVVRFDGREWRVARTFGSHVEIYRVDEAPRVVSLADVIRVPVRRDVELGDGSNGKRKRVMTDGGWDEVRETRREYPEPEALEADWQARWGDAPFDVGGVDVDDGDLVIDTSRDDDPVGRFTYVERPDYRGETFEPVPKILFGDDEDRSGTVVEPLSMYRCVSTGNVFYAPDIRGECACPVCGAETTGTDDPDDGSETRLVTDGGRDVEDGSEENGVGIKFSDATGVTDVDTSHLPDDMTDATGIVDLSKHLDPVECTVCEAEFGSEIGMKSHRGQVHPDWDADQDDDDVDRDAVDADKNGDGDGQNQVILTDDMVPDDEDDGQDLDDREDAREQSMKTVSDLWDDARRSFEMASVKAMDVTRRDALSTALKALERECEWMSVRERSGDGYQDLWRWVEGEGWADDAHGWIAERMDQELDTDADRRTVRKAVHHLAVRNKVDQDTLNAREFDETLIPVRNGVINVDDVEYDAETMSIDFSSVELQDMQPEHRFTYRIDTEWDPDAADLDGLDEWVEKITATPGDVRTVWELAGHSLHPRYPVDVFGVLVGGGGSGKSMLLKVIMQMIGEVETSSLSISKMETNDFVGPHVVNSRANINTELNGKKIQSIQTLKTMSAGEKMYVEQKREKGYEAKNDATMIFASDNPPAFPDDNRNDALKRRLYPVELPGKFVDDPDPSNPYEFRRRPKPEVEAELQSNARLKAALVRAVEGLVRLLEEGDFTTSMGREERLQRYESFADPARHFTFHCLEDAGPDSQIEYGVFQETLDAFCDAMDHSGRSVQKLTNVLDDMTSLSYSKGRTRSWSDEQSKHTVYSGLRFSEEALREFVPEHAKDKLDLSAVHEAESDDTRPTAIDDHGSDENSDVDADGEDVDVRDVVTSVIDDLAPEHGDDGVPTDAIIDESVDRTGEDVDRDDVEHVMDTLRLKGRIYEPRVDGRWRCTYR